MSASPSTSDPRREPPRPPAPVAIRWQPLVLLAAAAVLAWPAARLLFSAFMVYDDEGYVLNSLKNFAEHGGLYRDVYSQYGPFPFVFWWLLHELGVPFTHFAGRIVTLAAWLGAGFAGAAIVLRATRQLPAALAVLGGTVAYLWVMVSEPSHPGGLIVATLALAAGLGVRALAAERPAAWALGAGAAAAVLVLTKINVGGLFVLSCTAWILLHHEQGGVRRAAPAIVAAGAVLLPLALMRPLLGQPWVQTYALAAAAAGVAAALAGSGGEARRGVGWRTFGLCVLAGTGVAAAVLAAVLARGATWADLLDGMLLGPLRHPVAFSLTYTWPPGVRAWAVLLLGLAFAAQAARRRGRAEADTVVALLRLGVLAGTAYSVLRFPTGNTDRLVFAYAAPCLWLFVWRLPGEGGPAKAALTWLVLVWLGQYLHAFPVAGSQIAWGTFLLLPIAAVGGYGAAAWLADNRPAWRGMGAARRLGPAVAVGLAALVAVRCFQAGDRYRTGSDLGLPGAEFVRLPSEATALYRVLVLNAAAHGDVLFSEPGMFSLNLWSGVRTPTLANVTHWFSLLGPERQRAIRRELEASPRSVAILHREHIEFLASRGFPPGGELHDWLAREFVPVFTLDNFEFRVREGRQIEPLLLGEMELFSDAEGRENTALKLRVLLPPGREVARIEVAAMKPAELAPPLVFDATNARLEALGAAPRPLAWPWRAETPVTIRVHFDRFRQQRPVAGALIVLRDAAGEEVALARLRE